MQNHQLRYLEKKRKKEKKDKLKKRLTILIVAICVVGGSSYLIYDNFLNPPEEIGTINEQENISEEAPVFIEDEIKIINLENNTTNATLVKYEDIDILIDMGSAKNGRNIAEKLMQNITGDLDYIINTNTSSDRVGGYKEIFKTIKNIEVKNIFYSYNDKSKLFKDYLKIASRKVKPLVAKEDAIVMGNNITFNICKPVYANGQEIDSLICMIQNGSKINIFASDVTEKELKLLNNTYLAADEDVEILIINKEIASQNLDFIDKHNVKKVVFASDEPLKNETNVSQYVNIYDLGDFEVEQTSKLTNIYVDRKLLEE